MNKKKIAALLVAGVMTVGVVGGTLAWFTSNDSVTNIFETGKVNNPDDANGNGVEIWEDYTPATSVIPGDTTTKLVQTQNTTDYDSFIRVKITPQWEKEKVTIDDKEIQLFADKIILNFGENLGDTYGKWLKGDDGYYYYMGKVAGGKFTNPLLESVTLKSDAGNEYRGVKFDVLVEAESIQADNNAHNDQWKDAGENVSSRLDYYENQQATGEVNKYNEHVTITNTDTREVTVTP